MTDETAPLEHARRGYAPRLPRVLRGGIAALELVERSAPAAVRDAEAIRARFPRTSGRPLLRFVAGRGPAALRALRLGVVLSGGQAPGGHNVIAGLLDTLLAIHPSSALVGFRGGPRGILTGKHVELDPAAVAPFRNTGGFDLLGSGRDKIETGEQLRACAATCARLALDGLVIVGGDDSNTNAALLAEHFVERGLPISVNGVPKTIDGDLGGPHLELPFGFDTATRVYAELVGNICRDAKSAGKYWHFIKLMGRSASHVTLECALAARPNVTLIGEEIEERGWTLAAVADRVAAAVRQRVAAGRRHGVCLVPEGLIEFVPEMRRLIAELNASVASSGGDDRTPDPRAWATGQLGAESRAAFAALPDAIQRQLLLDRDAHGNVRVSQIETEQLLSRMVAERLREGDVELRVQHHFLGYEGRCSHPTNFDADYTYALGAVAALLAARGRTGYLCSAVGLAGPAESWQPLGVPLTSMMQLEQRKGREVAVIGKTLVRTDSGAFRDLAAHREAWAAGDAYLHPGPIQYFGPAELSDARPRTLVLGRGRAG